MILGHCSSRLIDLGHAHEALVVHAAIVSPDNHLPVGRKREELSHISNSRAGQWVQEPCRSFARAQMGQREAELTLTLGSNLLST